MSQQNPTALMLLAHGCEELEAVAPLDILRRGGVDVTVATIETNHLVTGRNAISLHADNSFSELGEQDYDLIVLPGGPGHKTLRENGAVLALLKRQYQEGRWLAAICAAPTVLHEAGLLAGRRYTGHQSIAEELPDLADEPVVVDGKIITSRGAGTATRFGLVLVSQLVGEAKAREVAASIHYEVAL